VSTARLVAAPQVKALSFEIPPGLRGMAIPVSIKDTPAALIAPGDFVDVIVSTDADVLNQSAASATPSAANGKAAATLVQNVQVLSVDRNFANTGVVYDSSTRGTPPGSKDDVSFVTLAVTPEQAQLLWLAQDGGELTLVLRAFGDDKVLPLNTQNEPLTLP
jgi:pilus assembly protein CpaB